MTVIQNKLFDCAHLRNDRGEVIGSLDAEIVLWQVECGDSSNMVLERLHDDLTLAWSQAIVDEYDGENGERVSLNSLSDWVSRLLCLKVLISEVDYWTFGIINDQAGPR